MSEEIKKVKIIEPENNNKDKEPKKQSTKEAVLDWIKTFAIALLIAIFIKQFIMDATRVSGESMLNTLHHDDMLMVNKIGKHFGDYSRGDIIILKAPDYPNRLYVKRIVGEPGDTVKLSDEKVYINGEELIEPYTSVDYTLPDSEYTEWYLFDDQYFVMGDNRLEGASNDSRRFGPILKQDIVGHAFIRFYPFSDFGLIDNNPYGAN